MNTVYLLLGLGVPDKWSGKTMEPSLKPIFLKDFAIRPIHLLDRGTRFSRLSPKHTIYSLKFNDGRRDDVEAQRIADAICASMTFVSGSTLDEGIMAYPVPDKLVKKHNIIIRHEVINLKKTRLERHLEVMQLTLMLHRVLKLSSYDISIIFEILPEALNEDMFEALHFFQESVREFYFPWRYKVIGQPERAPLSAVEKKKAENALQNAFKTIEALIGDLPTDDQKLRTKLTKVGLDPDEKIGYEVEESLLIKLRKINEARDKKAAHGKTIPNRTIAYYELMEAQDVAAYVLDTVLAKRLKIQQDSS